MLMVYTVAPQFKLGMDCFNFGFPCLIHLGYSFGIKSNLNMRPTATIEISTSQPTLNQDLANIQPTFNNKY